MERLHKVCNGARLSAAEFAKRWRNWSASAGLRAVTSATIAEFESLLIGVPPMPEPSQPHPPAFGAAEGAGVGLPPQPQPEQVHRRQQPEQVRQQPERMPQRFFDPKPFAPAPGRPDNPFADFVAAGTAPPLFKAPPPAVPAEPPAVPPAMPAASAPAGGGSGDGGDAGFAMGAAPAESGPSPPRRQRHARRRSSFSPHKATVPPVPPVPVPPAAAPPTSTAAPPSLERSSSLGAADREGAPQVASERSGEQEAARSPAWSAAEELKGRGNGKYEAKDYAAALQYYQRALGALGAHPLCEAATGGGRDLVAPAATAAGAAAVRSRASSYHANCAAALTQLGRLSEALRECDAALRLDAALPKSLLRAAHVFMSLGEYVRARELYERASRAGATADGANGLRMCGEAEQEMGRVGSELAALRRAGAQCKSRQAFRDLSSRLEASCLRCAHNEALKALRAELLAAGGDFGEARSICLAAIGKPDASGPSHGEGLPGHVACASASRSDVHCRGTRRAVELHAREGAVRCGRPRWGGGATERGDGAAGHAGGGQAAPPARAAAGGGAAGGQRRLQAGRVGGGGGGLHAGSAARPEQRTLQRAPLL